MKTQFKKLANFLNGVPQLEYHEENKNKFKSLAMSFMKAVAKAYPDCDSDVSWNAGGVAVSGDASVRIFNGDTGIHIFTSTGYRSALFIRTISSMKDYTGGANNWCNFTDNGYANLIRFMERVLGAPTTPPKKPNNFAEKFADLAMKRKDFKIKAPSMKQANRAAFNLMREYSITAGITIWKLGRTTTRCTTQNDHFEYDYDAANKDVYVFFEGGSREDLKLKEKIEKLIPNNIKWEDTSEKSCEEIDIKVKLFNAGGAGVWHIYDKVDDDVYWCHANLGDSRFAECGTVSLRELASIQGAFGLGVERDRYFQTKKLSEVI